MPILLLSSSTSFIDGAEEKLNINFKGKKIAYVISAVMGTEDRGYYMKRKEDMEARGWDYEEIDLVGKKETELSKFFSDKDIIFVEGGSTFYLLKAVRESGFDNVVREHLNKGRIYVGSSAGAYIACPSIDVAVKINKRHNWDHCGLTDFKAMNFVPYLVRVHYQPEDDEAINELRKETGLEIRTLSDGEMILEDRIHHIQKTIKR